MCFAPLTCTATGDCVKYDANLAGFKEALARKQGRIVTCESASVSSCGEFRGFDFNGDIHRHELRWFAEDGTLVAQRNVTDYPEYCDGKARVRVLGRLPECGEAQLSETLCGDKPQAVRTPEDDVGRFLKPPAAPGD